MDQPFATQKKRRRWLRLGSAVVFAIALVAITAFAIRLSIVEALGRHALATAGVADSGFVVSRFDTTELRFDRVRLGPDVKARSIAVFYTLGGLIRGGLREVVVEGLDVDFSRPDEGFLGFLRGKIADAKGSAADANSLAFPLPRIRLTDARVHGAIGPASFTATVAGSVAPDFSARATATVDGRLEAVPGHPLEIRGLAAEIVVETGAKDVQMRFTGGRVADTGSTPLLAPAIVGGDARYDGVVVSFAASAVMAGNRVRLGAEGRHDPVTGDGKANLRLVPVTFAVDGLQPFHLIPVATIIERAGGSVSAEASVSWQGTRLIGRGDFTSSDVSFSAVGVTVDGLNATMRLSADAGTAEIQLDVPGARLQYAASMLALDDLAARMTVKEGDEAVAVKLERGTVRHLENPAWFAPLTLRGEGRLRGDDMRFQIEALAADGQAKITLDGGHDLRTRAGAGRATLAPVRFSKHGMQPTDLAAVASLPGQLAGIVDADADLVWAPSGVDGTLRATVDELSYAAADFAFDDVSMRLIITSLSPQTDTAIRVTGARGLITTAGQRLAFNNLATAVTLRPGWQTARLRLTLDNLRHATAPPWLRPMAVTGEVCLRQTTATFDGEIVIKGTKATFSVNGQHDLDTGKGRVGVMVRPTVFQSGGLQPMDLVPALDMLKQVEGSVSADFDLHWENKEYDGTARLGLESLFFATDTLNVEGLGGEVRIDHLNPLAILESQNLRAKRVVVAVPLENPSFRFRVAPKRGETEARLFIDQAEAGIAGGRILISNVVLDPLGETNNLNVELEGVDLEQVMKMADIEGVSASGTLNGRLPLRLTKDTVLVEDGHLESAKSGILRIHPEQARRALAGGGEQVDLLLDVLKDFHYDTLSLRVDKAGRGDDVMRLSTKGRNPAVRAGQPFTLNVNLSVNLDKVFAVVLEGYRLSQSALRTTLGGREVR